MRSILHAIAIMCTVILCQACSDSRPPRIFIFPSEEGWYFARYSGRDTRQNNNSTLCSALDFYTAGSHFIDLPCDYESGWASDKFYIKAAPNGTNIDINSLGYRVYNAGAVAFDNGYIIGYIYLGKTKPSTGYEQYLKAFIGDKTEGK